MQILLISNPEAPVKEFNLSAREILVGLLLLILALFCLNWFIASITTITRDLLLSSAQANHQVEKEASQNPSDYRLKLHELQAHLRDLQINVVRLSALSEGLKPLNSTSDQTTLTNDIKIDSNKKLPSRVLTDPQGGPLKFTQELRAPEESYGVGLDLALQEAITLNSKAVKLQQKFSQNKSILSNPSLGLPLPFKVSASSGLGYRIDPMTSQIAWHDGTDFPAPYGTLILVAASGIVIKAGWSGDYGNMVEVKHSNGSITRYAHAQELLVQVGQNVKKSQPIGKVGSTGRSTGPHLHYEIL